MSCPYECEIVENPAQPVLIMRTTTSVQELQGFFGRAFGAIIQYLGELGEQPENAAFAAYHNMDMQHLEVEAGFPVKKTLPGKGEILSSEMAAGKYATCLFVGPYDAVPPAYEALTAFIKEKGFEATGVAYEFYYDPPETPPDKIRTRIMFPLR